MSTSASMAMAYEGNLVLVSDRPRFRVIEGGRSKATVSRRIERQARCAPVPVDQRTRVAIVCTTVVMMLTLVCAWIAADAMRNARIEDALSTINYEAVTIMPGDSLWNIAQEHPVEGCSTAELVHHIRKVNRLDDAMLRPGMHLTVPQNN